MRSAPNTSASAACRYATSASSRPQVACSLAARLREAAASCAKGLLFYNPDRA